MATRFALVLHTSSPATLRVEAEQRQLLALLAALRLTPRLVDGADAANRELRAALWASPGAVRATYPFLFIASRDGAAGAETFEAVGDFAVVAALHEGAQHRQVAHAEGDLARRLAGCA